MSDPLRAFVRWLDTPDRILRHEMIRIFAPLATLGFLAPRLAHVDEWLGTSGFRVPELVGNVRQPMYVPALSPSCVDVVAVAIVVSGLACSLGIKTRWSSLIFAALLAFVTLSDRVAAFTVSKISPVIVLSFAIAPCGKRVGVDAWLAARRGDPLAGTHARMGGLRFLQLFLPVFYCASGIAKARGSWLSNDIVLYSHLHDSYQTVVSYLLAGALPRWVWPVLQWPVLAFEILAPLWFGLRITRPFASAFAIAMHVMIGLMFGPVVWFALLMITLNVGGYMADRCWALLERWISRMESRTRVVKSELEPRPEPAAAAACPGK